MDRQRRGLGGSIELGVYIFLFSLFLYETVEDVWKSVSWCLFDRVFFDISLDFCCELRICRVYRHVY